MAPYSFTPFHSEFLQREDTECLPLPAEASGLLRTQSGQWAHLDVALDHPSLADPELLHERYKGTGIYDVSRIGSMAAFWAVVEQNRVTAGKVRKILGQVADILVQGKHEQEHYWPFED